MEKYKIVKNNNIFNIMEHENDYIIKSYQEYNDAKKTKNMLNKGSGFGGFTPLFFTENYYQHKYNIKDFKEE